MNREELERDIRDYEYRIKINRSAAEADSQNVDELRKQLAALDEIQPGTWCKFRNNGWGKSYIIGTFGGMWRDVYLCKEDDCLYDHCEPYPEPDVLAKYTELVKAAQYCVDEHYRGFERTCPGYAVDALAALLREKR